MSTAVSPLLPEFDISISKSLPCMLGGCRVGVSSGLLVVCDPSLAAPVGGCGRVLWLPRVTYGVHHLFVVGGCGHIVVSCVGVC